MRFGTLVKSLVTLAPLVCAGCVLHVHRDLDPLAWPSTTHFLSVLVAPDLAPRLLVVDPRANYFWISCRTAMRNQETNRALPAHTRLLVRLHACLHR